MNVGTFKLYFQYVRGKSAQVLFDQIGEQVCYGIKTIVRTSFQGLPLTMKNEPRPI